MKQLSTLVAAIATFCCSTLLQAQTLDDLVNLDALLACECELVLEPVCVDLGVGVTFPAPNACVAECLSLPIVEGGDCMTPEALSMLPGTDGALYSGPAAYNLELCPSGFHVPNDVEWDSFASAGGTIIDQSAFNAVGCGGGASDWGSDQYFWTSSNLGGIWYGSPYDLYSFGCCYPEYQMLIKCVSD